MDITRLSLAVSFSLLLRAGILALFCSTNLAIADSGDAVDQLAIEKSVHKALPGTRITSVQASVLSGLVEIIAGPNVLYADPT